MNYSVGENVDSWCMSCKLMLAHTIEAVIGAEIKKVHCNTCNRPHRYRPNPPGTGKAAKKVGVLAMGVAKISGLKASDFEDLIKNQDVDKAKPYATKEAFVKGDLLKHTSFGVGYVTANKNSNKIEVLFETGPKVLVHSRF